MANKGEILHKRYKTGESFIKRVKPVKPNKTNSFMTRYAWNLLPWGSAESSFPQNLSTCCLVYLHRVTSY